MTKLDPRTQTKTRQPPKLFDAQNATGTLLLLTGSLALGLTAFWITPNKASTQTAAVASTTASDAGQTEQYASNTDTSQDDESGDDGWGAQHQTYQQNAQAQSGFSPQPMQAPGGFTRGS